MKLKFLLFFAGITGIALAVNRVYSEPTPTPTFTSTPAAQTRITVDPTETNLQLPSDTNPSGNTPTRSAAPSRAATPAKMQYTVIAILSTVGSTKKDELAPQATSTNASGLVPTGLVLEPTDTPIPSLLDKY